MTIKLKIETTFYIEDDDDQSLSYRAMTRSATHSVLNGYQLVAQAPALGANVLGLVVSDASLIYDETPIPADQLELIEDDIDDPSGEGSRTLTGRPFVEITEKLNGLREIIVTDGEGNVLFEGVDRSSLMSPSKLDLQTAPPPLLNVCKNSAHISQTHAWGISCERSDAGNEVIHVTRPRRPWGTPPPKD